MGKEPVPRIEVPCLRCEGIGSLDGPQGSEDEYSTSCANCKGHGYERQTVYANVYKVAQNYGGPEEGGWWYDSGEPLESVKVDPFMMQDERDKLVVKLKENWADEQHPRGRRSCAGGPDVEVCFQNHFAEAFPQNRPHYE